MRPVPAHWHTETWICSLRGHVAPAAGVRQLRPDDRRLGLEVGDGVRFVRCLRCDTWLELDDPVEPTSDTLPPLDELDLPRRGKPLWDAVTLRIISLDKAVHSVLFTIAAVVLVGIQLELGGIRRWAQGLVDLLSTGVGDHVVLGRWLDRLARLDPHELRVSLAFAVIYAVVEGVESWALWTERRWGEYLTVAATAGFLPLEIVELTHSITVTKVVALLLNLAIVVWLIVAKHLFGVRGGTDTLAESVNWAEVLASPTPAGS